MSTLVVKVCKIKEVNVHSNAEKLELAIVNGWQCVIPKDRYKADDLIVYFPPDTALPETETDKLGVTNYCQRTADQGMRIRQVRLRGEPSFGLIVDLPDNVDWKEGDTVDEYYDAKKYIPPVKGHGGDILGANHALFDKFTDIQNLRNFVDVFEDGEEVVCTEKLHGCVHENTNIVLANGEKIKIKDIDVGDMVLSFDENSKKIVSKEVKNVLVQPKTDKLKWIKLTFGENSIICTEDHPVLTENRGWVNAIDLSLEDDCVSIEMIF